jgi:phosphoglycolate phosphatase
MDLLIFDLDGTLIDSRLDLAHAVNATRAHMGMTQLDFERVYSYVGNGAPVLIRRALGEQATEPEVEAISRREGVARTAGGGRQTHGGAHQ